MEIYDIVMLIVLASACLFGAYKGFAWQLASIASIVFCYFVAFRFREPLSKSIVAEPPWDRFLAMLILFVGTSLVVWVGFNMVRRTIDRMKLKEFDRQIGALFGLLKGGLYCALITLFAVTLAGDSIREKIVASKSGRFIARNLDRSESVIPPEIHQFLRPYLDRLDDEFQGSKSGPAGDLAGQVFDGARASFSDGENPYVPPAFGAESQLGFQPGFQPPQSLPGNASAPSGNTSALPAGWRQ